MEEIGKSWKDSKKDRGSKKHIPLGLLPGIAAGLVLGLVISLPWYIFIPAGAAGAAAGILLFKPRKKSEKIAVTGINPEALEKTVQEGNQKLSRIRTLKIKISDSAIRNSTDIICGYTKKILDDVQNEPEDLPQARSFLRYYLDTAVTILEQYNEISSRAPDPNEVDKLRNKVASALGTLEKAFEKQYSRLLENNVLSLNTELTVLEKTLEMEGYKIKGEKK